jgi:uncharacterized protein YgiM (DUF1202 family)
MPKGLDIMLFLRARSCPVIAATLSLLFCATLVHAVEPYFASITATEVNVRSGPSTNYYIVTKLQAGDRVEVREEDAGWFGIVPPPGCFSLISKHYVDLDGKGGGVVNGNNVRVRAGSNRNPSRYAVQVKLNEGDEVEVMEDGPEGFLKIKPPKGAYAWIHGELTARASEKWVEPDTANSKPTAPSTTASAPRSSPADSIDDSTRVVSTDRSERTEATASPTRTSNDAPVQPEQAEPRPSSESTDRVAIYTWTEESGGKIKRSDTNTSSADASVKTTANPATSPQAMPSGDQEGDQEVVTAGVQQENATSTAQPTNRQPQSANPAPAITTNTSSQPAPGSQSTSRSAPFSSDSTGQVAIIKWNDSTQTTTTSNVVVPANQSAAGSTPSTGTQSTGTQATTTAPNPQPLSGTQMLTTQPVYVQPNSDSATSDQFASRVTGSDTITQPQPQTSAGMDINPTPAQTNVVSVIPYTGVDPRAELKLIDIEMIQELDKPLEQRQFGELMAKYRGITQADVDEASKLYAERRIHQLEVLSIRINAVGQINNLVSDVVETRQSASQQRSTISTTTAERPSIGFAAVGELRESMVFSSPVGPRRYRLIDPNDAVPRTLCYVEIPRDSTIDVSQYLGRIVGIRASRDFVETGNVDPISVLVASSIEPVSGNTSASVNTSASGGIPPMGDTSRADGSDDPDQIAIRPMVPAYNP